MKANYSIPSNVKKAALVLMQYDYGVKERGYSFEYINVYQPMCDILGEENVILFDFYDLYKSKGKDYMNQQLLAFIKSEKPDFTLFCLFENEFNENTINELKNYTTTIAYFFDDPWRKKFVKHWIKYFHFFSTPDYYMYKSYIADGLNKAILSPFGFNENVYFKKELPQKYEVSFVGGYSPLRKWIIEYLAKENISVKVFGRGWNNDKAFISQEEMVNVFNQSIINLNLSNGISKDIGMLASSIKSLKGIKHILLNRKNKEQVKGRHFEINACGGFQLSYFVPGLNLVYEIDKEIAVYEDIYNLADEIKLFLKNESMRTEIALNGYDRSIKEHSAQKYLCNLINCMFNK